MPSQQTMDILTSFGPALLGGLLTRNAGKPDPRTAQSAILDNILRANQGLYDANVGTVGNVAQANADRWTNWFGSQQQMGANAVNDAFLPNQMMTEAQQARQRGVLYPQIPAFFRSRDPKISKLQGNLALPPETFDIYKRMGSDEVLAQNLNSLYRGMSMRNPVGFATPNLGNMAGVPGTSLQPSLNTFASGQTNQYNTELGNYNTSLQDAIAGYRGAADKLAADTSGYIGGQNKLLASLQQEQKKKTSWWKKLIGLGAMAAAPFTGGLTAALAPAIGGSTALAAGLVNAGLGAAGAWGTGGNPLSGAILGGAAGAAFGPGGKWGSAIPSQQTKDIINSQNTIGRGPLPMPNPLPTQSSPLNFASMTNIPSTVFPNYTELFRNYRPITNRVSGQAQPNLAPRNSLGPVSSDDPRFAAYVRYLQQRGR